MGFFEMTEKGLEEVPDASSTSVERVPSASGTTVLGGMEGSRPLLVEVQALVGHPTPANPGRTVLGMDRSRMQMLLAVLGKIGFQLYDRDVFISAAGGVRITEPAADLAIAAAIASSHRNEPIDPRTLMFGEIGLVGEVRAYLIRHSDLPKPSDTDLHASLHQNHQCTMPLKDLKSLVFEHFVKRWGIYLTVDT